MDLGTVTRKLENGDYATLEDVAKDVHLVFDNAVEFNGTVRHCSVHCCYYCCSATKSMVLLFRT